MIQSGRPTVSRKDARDVRHRQIVASADGAHLATLLFGDEVTQEIEPGRHRLFVHNTLFWKTIHFDVEPGQHVRFNVVNRAGSGTLALLGLLGAAPLYLTVERVPE